MTEGNIDSMELVEGEIKPPFAADMRVTWIRHGNANYAEKEMDTGKYYGTLSQKGKDVITSQALELAEKIDKDHELIVLWASPKGRAQESANMMGKIFREKGIKVAAAQVKDDISAPQAKVITKESLRDVTTLNEQGIEFWGLANNWLEVWGNQQMAHEVEGVSSDLGQLEKMAQNGLESTESVAVRFNDTLDKLEKISSLYHLPDGRKLHMIVLTHEETLSNLLQTAYGEGWGYKSGMSVKNAETVTTDIFKADQSGKPKIVIDFRGMKANLLFDPVNKTLAKAA